MRQLRPQQRGELVLLVTAAVWGTSFVGVQAAMPFIGPMLLLALRFGVATLALLPFLHGASLDARAWYQGAALGSCLAVGFGLQTASLIYTTAAHTAFGTALMTVMVPIFSFVVWRHPWPGGTYLALLASLWGTACLMRPGAPGRVQLGDALSIACAMAFAVHIVLLTRFSRQSNLRALLVLQLGVAAALSALVCGLWPGQLWGHAATAPWQLWATVLYLGVVTTGLCVLGQVYGQARTSSTRAAFILALEPAFAAAFAYAVNGQSLSDAECLGGSLIVGAALLADRSLPRRT